MNASLVPRLSLVREDIRSLPVREIRADQALQSRVTLNAMTVDEYAAAMREGATFPAVVVFHDGRSFWLASGFHRIAAAKKARLPCFAAQVQRGSKRDAILYSVGQNFDHGLRRSNADKRAAVLMLLTDPEWIRWSDREIARQCRVSHPFVSAIRTSHLEMLPDAGERKRVVLRGGAKYKMNTEAIGTYRKTREEPPVVSCIVGDNGDLIREVARLYLSPGARIADVTWGKGVFWRQVDLKQYDFFPSDAVTCGKARHDFRRLPFDAGSMDVVVLDPPYVHDPGQMKVEADYQNAETTGGMSHDDILRLYAEGMKEAFRVLKRGGRCWVKCKDEVVAHVQRWSHIELLHCGEKVGFAGKDLFILCQETEPMVQHEQQHGRKIHSYLWILSKPARGPRR